MATFITTVTSRVKNKPSSKKRLVGMKIKRELIYRSLFSVFIRRLASPLLARTPVTASSPEEVGTAPELAAPLCEGSGRGRLGTCHWS